ncbi:MAG TPA: hypothetical protein VF292_01640 [Rhodanobacteraceae bacterium]
MTHIVININDPLKLGDTHGAPDNRSAREEDVPEDIDYSMDWPEPLQEKSGAAMLELSPPRVAAIAVKGCFSLYHLVREHAGQPSTVPAYLLRFAHDYEEYLIPAAEQMYFPYFTEHGTQPDEIPRELYELGCVECERADKCTSHAQRLHDLIEAYSASGEASSTVLSIAFPDAEARLLIQVLLTEYAKSATARAPSSILPE